MNWFIWALLPAFLAGATAVLAKIGVNEINSNLATAIRTVVILVSPGRLQCLPTPSRFQQSTGEPGSF
jgi:uncharacterized membrane protein